MTSSATFLLHEKQTEFSRIQSVVSTLLPVRRALHAVALLEAVHASAGVNQLLLAGVERMALRADIDAQLLLHGTGLEGLAADAADDRLAVIRMDLLFHGFHLFLPSDAEPRAGQIVSLRFEAGIRFRS